MLKRKNNLWGKKWLWLIVLGVIIIFYFVYRDAQRKYRLPCIKNNICTNNASICLPGGHCKIVDAVDTSFRPIKIGLCVCEEKATLSPPRLDLNKQKAKE
jgi:hypothetical protein